MNVNTIKNAIIGSISKYKGQQITETLLAQIQDDLYDLAKPIGQEGIISLEYTDENYTDVNKLLFDYLELDVDTVYKVDKLGYIFVGTDKVFRTVLDQEALLEFAEIYPPKKNRKSVKS